MAGFNPATLIPTIVNAGINYLGQNAANAATANAQGKAQAAGEQYAQQQQTAAEQYQQQALANALKQMMEYQQANPAPATQLGAIQGPTQFGAGQTIGGGIIGPGGTPAPAPAAAQAQQQQQINPQMMQQLMALFQRQQQAPPAGVPQPGAQAPPQNPAQAQNVQNLAQTMLRSGQPQVRRSFGPTPGQSSGANAYLLGIQDHGGARNTGGTA